MANDIAPHTPQGEIILYQPDETVRLEVRLENETVWLTQAQMAELFETTRNNITLHVRNVFKEGELKEGSVCKESLLTASDGKRYRTKEYNLDVIISVGYRVKSHRGTEFRQWANQVLKQYLLKGYSVNERFERLEQRVTKTEEKIDFFVRTSLPPREAVFFDGQMFDAYTLVCQLVKSAKQSIILIDRSTSGRLQGKNYADETVLPLLDKREDGVQATIYTQHVGQQLQLDIKRHNRQYAPIAVEHFNRSHDRFLILDDTVYHLGASLKDMGRKWCAIMKMSLDKDIILNQL